MTVHFGEKLLKWVGVFMTILALLGLVYRIWLYFELEEQRNAQWYADDRGWNEAILSDLRRIANDQSSQRILLEDLLRESNQRFLQIERSFEELEDEHRAIVTAIYEGLVDINWRIGQHQGEHLHEMLEGQ